MTVTVNFDCDGCGAQAKSTDWLREGFVSFSGQGWGFGNRQPLNSVRDVTPEGWVAFDPYTSCCYCPKCWREIEQDGEVNHAAMNGGEK